jgi:ABC-2 type transport system ATP-binding protein
METILALNDLVCQRGPFRLGPLNWDLPAGIFSCLVGPNGAGKTTFMQSLMGLIQLQSGVWTLADQRVNPSKGDWKEHIGYAFDGQVHYERLSIHDNLKLHAGLRSTWDHKLCQELLEAFGLNSRLIVATLSRGQRQALSLILALAHRPRLLLLDEVTNGMDSLVRKAFSEMILRVMAESEMSVLMATHVMSDVAQLADRILFLQSGRILADVDKDSLFESWRQLSCRVARPATAPAHSLRWEQKGDSLRFITNAAAQDLRMLKDQDASHIESHPLTLDEICFYTLEAARHA